MVDRVDVVWRPDPESLGGYEISRFLDWLAAERGTSFADYMDAWRWSVDDPGEFWESLWRYEEIVGERGDGAALEQERMPGSEWFPGARLNYAEHLLRHSRESTALLAVGEDDEVDSISWERLERDAGALAHTLRQLGVSPGDRVVAYAQNLPEAVIALIATTSLGAIWSICSPDFGTAGVVSRFRQLQPKVLIAVDGYRFGGKTHPRHDEVAAIAGALPELEHVIWIDAIHPGATPSLPAIMWAQAIAHRQPLNFERVPFDHPLWVLYSSGTTGSPKGIVHGHGGIVLEHLKLLRFGLDLGPDDRLLLLASTSWMVWNTMVSGLLRGAPVVLLDGNPAGADMRRVWRTIEQLGVTVLGVGASLLHGTIKAGVSPRREFDLHTLREIMSTGSPLAADAYTWIAEEVGEHVWINSCSGGTDVCSAFVGGCPLLPVRAGRLQAPALGAAVAAWNEAGRPVVGEKGELVITRPLPSMPLFLWGDSDGSRYRDSYFAPYPGVWRHGDFISFDPDGSSVILGRSDATLNRNGIRMGSAEIYAIVEALPEVTEAMVIGVEEGEGYYMPLFVAIADGVDPDHARHAVVTSIRSNLSPRHVPDEIVIVPAIPHTKTGKKLEVPVKRLLQGHTATAVLDPATVDVPDLVDFYAEFAAARLHPTA